MNYIYQFHAPFLYIPNNKVKYFKEKILMPHKVCN